MLRYGMIALAVAVAVNLPPGVSRAADNPCNINNFSEDADLAQQCDDFESNCIQQEGYANTQDNTLNCQNITTQWVTKVNAQCAKGGGEYDQSCVANVTGTISNTQVQQASQQNNQFNNCVNGGGSGPDCMVQTGITPPPQQTATAPSCTGQDCGNIDYVPLEPLIPNSPPNIASDFGAYLNLMFKVLLTLGALLAVGRLTVGGIMYMTSEVMETKGDAKRWMTSSLYGLLLLAGSWLILFTINPNLLKFNLIVPGSGQVGTTQSTSSNTPATPSQADINACKSPNSLHSTPNGTWVCS